MEDFNLWDNLLSKNQVYLITKSNKHQAEGVVKATNLLSRVAYFLNTYQTQSD
jgi:hypothetical protein